MPAWVLLYPEISLTLHLLLCPYAYTNQHMQKHKIIREDKCFISVEL